MTIRIARFFLFAAVFYLPACHAGGYPPYAIGFATPSGNEIWVSAAHFDNRTWGTPVGSIACCWEESGKASLIFERPLPKDIYVNWLEKASNTRYEATVTLPNDIDGRAHKLPDYIYIPNSQHEKPAINLIIGIAPKGQITIWLSNSPYLNENIQGRVLEVLAITQATATQEIPPYYPRKAAVTTDGVQ